MPSLLAGHSQGPANAKNIRSRYFIPLTRRGRIDHLFRNGRRIFGPHLMLRFDIAADKHSVLCVVFAVSSRLGPATFRNRIRRRLREALFLILKERKVPCSGFEIAIVPRKEVAEMDFAELCGELREVMRRLSPVAAGARRK